MTGKTTAHTLDMEIIRGPNHATSTTKPNDHLSAVLKHDNPGTWDLDLSWENAGVIAIISQLAHDSDSALDFFDVVDWVDESLTDDWRCELRNKLISAYALGACEEGAFF